MTAFFIGAGRVKDPEALAQYSAATPETFAAFGGEVIARGKKSQDVTGEGGADAMIVVRFKDMEALDAWYQSADYQALLPIREQALDLVITAYQEPT